MARSCKSRVAILCTIVSLALPTEATSTAQTRLLLWLLLGCDRRRCATVGSSKKPDSEGLLLLLCAAYSSSSPPTPAFPPAAPESLSSRAEKSAKERSSELASCKWPPGGSDFSSAPGTAAAAGGSAGARGGSNMPLPLLRRGTMLALPLLAAVGVKAAALRTAVFFFFLSFLRVISGDCWFECCRDDGGGDGEDGAKEALPVGESCVSIMILRERVKFAADAAAARE